ncbi:hypothetical protein J4H92_14765 [Leucobacter weissii]|uniref:DNA primase/polymerase bifunctional N-terminal domain-containing protein n=1 Tax=Leucobacter weissii TaxID=1983706 RepID=A0A939S798_9MICO|nr:hypothetical protein [Leucobacter weissii]MBO1903204.1 hypothetical protein [Leucobacter weissii]
MRVAAVSDDGSTLNSYPPQHITPVTETAPERPWAIYLTDREHAYRLLCFDLDGKTPEAAEAAEQDAAALARLLTDAGLAPVVCQSGPQGGRHIWIALREGVSAELVHRLARLAKTLHTTLDLSPIMNPAAGCVRPPGAPHRHGGSSTVIDGKLHSLTRPSGTEAAVAAAVERLAQLVNDRAATERTDTFSAETEQDDRKHPHIPGTKRPLAPAAAAALRADAAAGDASAVLWRVLTGAAAAHWQYSDLARLLDTAPGLEHARTRREHGRRIARRPDERARVLRRQWDRAVAYIASGRRVVGRDETFDARADAIATLVLAVQGRADAAPGRWNRGGGPADRRVLDALSILTLQAVSADVEADTRRLALMAGIGRETARTALLRLSEDGWIVRTREAEGRGAAHWKIGPQVVIHSNPDEGRSQVAHRPPGSGSAARNALLLELTNRLDSAAHDLFTLGALGLHAGNVYARCTHDPLPLAQLARLTGSDAAHTVQTLTQLIEADVLLLSRDGWHKPAADRRDAAADARGVTGRLAARAERYAVERELWAWWQDELDWMNTAPAERPKRPAPGQLVLVPDVGPTPRPIHPRTPYGRADYRAARCILTGTTPPARPRPVPVSDAERLIIDILGATPIATIPFPDPHDEPQPDSLEGKAQRSGAQRSAAALS